MKMNLRLINSPVGDPRATPMELKVMAQPIATKIVELMRLHGIKSIGAQPVQVGNRTVLKKTYTPLSINPPGAYVTVREEAASLLAQYVSLLGIIEVDIQPTESDLKVIETTWTQIETQVAKGMQDSDMAKAPPVIDPQGQPVVSPTKTESDV